MRKKIRALFEVEDQRDWQSECPRNPFSCFFCFLLELLNVRTILDLTYGIGAFYEACPQLDIIAVDIIQRDWLVKPREFHRMEALQFLRQFHNRIDAIVLDPPFTTVPSSRVRERRPYLYEGHMPFSEVISIIKLAKTKAKYTILKYMPDTRQFIVSIPLWDLRRANV